MRTARTLAAVLALLTACTGELQPIGITEQFGDDPDVDEVDAHVRAVMQEALDRLAEERNLPILG